MIGWWVIYDRGQLSDPAAYRARRWLMVTGRPCDFDTR